MIKIYAGVTLIIDHYGYLKEPLQWNADIASAIALEEEIKLTEKHLLVIEHLRSQYFHGNQLSIRNINNSGIVTLKEFYSLFPGAPLKKACKIGGLPNPESCV